MQRYFFEFSLGQKRVTDDAGEEFVSRVEALKYGRLLACEMAKGSLVTRRDACVVVRDDNGHELGRIYLFDIMQAAPFGDNERRVLH
jgi:hypothetical protein